MNLVETINAEIAAITSGNNLYNTYREQWQYLLESYLGGSEYQNAQHLTRYQLETDGEYQARLRSTPLDNHCQSVISVYKSFLFRTEPERNYGSLSTMHETADFLLDADFEGRSLNAFMKEVSTWASVFGHTWIIVAKPNINATSRAEEIAAGIRPYINLLTPLVVLDWAWNRDVSGRFVLDYLKYAEDINGSVQTIKEWTSTTIRTRVVDIENSTINSDIIEDNQLGFIPAVICYNGRSTVRGIGVSDIADIADMQKFIYNATSEVEQSIRLDSHPSLVKTLDTVAGIGAGSIIQIPENLDPGLKPYLLDFKGANIDSIYKAINNAIISIDKMANTGAARSTLNQAMSGVAMETEFQLLNAKLSEKADNIELAEEQIWKIWARYMNATWDGSIEYPGSFNIRDTSNEIAQLKTASETGSIDPRVRQAIDMKVLDWLDLDEDELGALADTTIMVPDSITETGELPDD